MAKKETGSAIESPKSKGVAPIETLTVEGLLTRYYQINKQILEKVAKRKTEVLDLFGKINLGEKKLGKEGKLELMKKLDVLLKKFEKNQKVMEKSASSITESDPLNKAINDEPKVFTGAQQSRQDEQAYAQELWEKQKQEIAEQKRLESAKKKEQEGKFVTSEGSIESKQIRFENSIPDALNGVLSLEITNKPPKEVGNNFGTGELHLIPGTAAGQEKLGISVNGKNLEVKEVYENIDGSWTINAGKYEFRTEGLAPQTKEAPVILGSIKTEGMVMAEAAKAGMGGREAQEFPEVAQDLSLRERLNIAKLKEAGKTEAEIKQELSLTSIENLRKDPAVVESINGILLKISAGEKIEDQLNTLSTHLNIPVDQLKAIQHTLDALIEIDANSKIPRDSKVAAASKFLTKAGLYAGGGFLAIGTGGLGIAALSSVRMLDVVMTKRHATEKHDKAKSESLKELSGSSSELSKKISAELVSRLALIKQNLIDNSAQALSALPAEYEGIKNLKSDSERQKSIESSNIKLEALGEKLYLQSFEYYKANRPDLNDDQITALAKDAKFKFISEERARRTNVINSVVNKTFDQRVDNLIDKTIPTFRDAVKGTGLTENKSLLYTAAMAGGMAVALRTLPRFAALQFAAFTGGGVLGEMSGKKLFGKELQNITLAEIQKLERDPSNENTIKMIGKVESQLNNPEFANQFPTQHQELQKYLDQFDQEFLAKLKTDEERREYTADRGAGISKWLAREKDQKDKIALSRWLGRLALMGGVAGYYAYDQVSQPQPQAEAQPQTPVVETAAVGKPVELLIEKGEGVTQAIERGLAKEMFSDEQLKGMINNGSKALEHAHQNGSISDATYQKMHEALTSGSMQDKAHAAVESWGLDNRDYDLQYTGNKVTITGDGSFQAIWRGTELTNHIAAPTEHDLRANTLGLPPETPNDQLAFKEGIAQNMDQKIAEASTPEEAQELMDQKERALAAQYNLPTVAPEGITTELRDFASGILNLRESGLDVKITPEMHQEMANRGFSYDATKHAFIKTEALGSNAGNVHTYQIGEDVKKLEFTKNGNDIMMRQVTNTQDILTAIKPSGEAVSKVTERGFLNRIFGS